MEYAHVRLNYPLTKKERKKIKKFLEDANKNCDKHYISTKDFLNSIYGEWKKYFTSLDGFLELQREMHPQFYKYEEGRKPVEPYYKYVLDDEVASREFAKFVKNEDPWKKWDDEWEKYMNKPITPIKIFYSQPMHDKTEEEIEDKFSRLDNYIYGILRYSGFETSDINRLELIDNIHHDGIDPDAGRLVHLGASIQKMQDADLIIFEENLNFEQAKGCKVELCIAEVYGLRHIFIDDFFSYHITTWFKKYLENENVSK